MVNFFPFGLFGFPFSALSPPKLYGSLLFDAGGAAATGFLFSGGGFLFIAEREREREGGVGKRERGFLRLTSSTGISDLALNCSTELLSFIFASKIEANHELLRGGRERGKRRRKR